jgi:hypothetical protein
MMMLKNRSLSTSDEPKAVKEAPEKNVEIADTTTSAPTAIFRGDFTYATEPVSKLLTSWDPKARKIKVLNTVTRESSMPPNGTIQRGRRKTTA